MEARLAAVALLAHHTRPAAAAAVVVTLRAEGACGWWDREVREVPPSAWWDVLWMLPAYPQSEGILQHLLSPCGLRNYSFNFTVQLRDLTNLAKHGNTQNP